MKSAVLIFAVALFAFTQQKSQIDHARNQGQSKTQSSQDKGVPSAPSQSSTDGNQKPTGDASQNQNKPVSITSIPKISVKPDEDWVMVICTVILTGVGVVGTVAAVKTLRHIRRQADTLDEHKSKFEELAQAAKDNAKASRIATEAMKGQLEQMETQTRETARAAQAAEISNNQNAAFFKMENRPWVGMSEELRILEKKATNPGQYEFTVGYTLKNFGSAPALNTVVFWGPIVEDVNNYNLVKAKVAEARKSGENIVSMTGNLLLPSAEKFDTCLFGEGKRPPKIVIPGCIVYRDTDGSIHHTELSYWIDFAEGEKAAFHTAWFQSAD